MQENFANTCIAILAKSSLLSFSPRKYAYVQGTHSVSQGQPKPLFPCVLVEPGFLNSDWLNTGVLGMKHHAFELCIAQDE